MRAREADPVEPTDLIERAQELAELRPEVGGEITAPRIDVLPEERHLADALLDQSRDFRDDVARSPALLAAADRGHDAIRALGVAAHRDLYPGLEAALPAGRKLGGEMAPFRETPTGYSLPTRADPLGQVRDRPGARRRRPHGDRARRCARAGPRRSTRRRR